jgi:hypothetical protein
MSPVVPRMRGVQFTGNNSAEVISLYTNLNTVLNNGVTSIAVDVVPGVSFGVQESVGGQVQQTLPYVVGLWAVCDLSQGGVQKCTAVEFADRYWTYIETSAYTCAAPSFAAALAATASGFGSLASITVPGAGNANFDVPIRPVQPSTAFTAVPFLTGSSSLLGSLSITGLTNGAVGNANKLSTVVNGVTVYDRVRVNVANSGLLQLAGAALLVHVSP